MDYKIFYYCQKTGDEVESQTPLLTDRDTMISVALQTLRDEGDFFGIIDESNTTLQFMVQSNSEILIDIPMPAKGGSYNSIISPAELENTLLAINPPFRQLIGWVENNPAHI